MRKMISGAIAVFFLVLRVTTCLRDVALRIEPRIVQRGGDSLLRCDYNLEGAQLYSVKFYRGRHEFYRYTPKEYPTTKVFPVEGITLMLDESNENQVKLKNVSFILSGRFSCEVTSENAPVVSTKTVSEDMWVVVFPKSLPKLTTDQESYNPGDILKARCTSAPSKPAAQLTFILNNVVVCSACETSEFPQGKLYGSIATLKIPLFSTHFSNGRMVLKCVAKIQEIYQQESEMVFYNDQDPVPERVTFNKASGFTSKIRKCVLTVLFFTEFFRIAFFLN